MNKGMFTSNKDDWETPQWLFDELNAEYYFTLDVAASDTNHKCDNYYTKEDDGLSKEWEGVVWCNPPYGKEIKHWIKKASESNCTVVMLLPARTDTIWFHNYILNKSSKITFLKGRLRFSNSNTDAPFPSMLVEFKNTIDK